MAAARRPGIERAGHFDVVLGKDDGIVESEVVLGKVHDEVSLLLGESM